MKGVSPWSLGLFAFCSLLLNVPAGLLLDQLLKYEYRFHPDLWDADGKPSGFLWCPREAQWLYTAMRPFPPPYKWLFITPPWIRAERRLLYKLNMIRLLHVLGTGLGLFFFACVFI
jgi:hypothetical protein